MSAALAWGCTPTLEGDGATTDAGPPPKVKQPPASKEGSASAPRCEGVTERGECVDGVAVYCDVARNELRRVDCRAIGKACVLDPVRGAKCEDPVQGAGDGGGCGDIDDVGFCDGETAVWCSVTEDDTLVQWDCAAEGKRCAVDECIYGAYCCGGSDQPGAGECPADLDEAGFCTGPGNNTATWCDSDGVVFELDCAATGERCEENTCAYGAYCCGDGASADECADLGWRGDCAGGVARWCAGEEIVEDDCSIDGFTCEVDTCGAGANCCEPTSSSPACEALGWAGACVDDLLRYCDGVEIVEIDCTASGQACEVDGCTPGEANCCESEATECEALGWEGECAGDVVRYCNGAGEIVEVDCGAAGDGCVFDGCWKGAAACCSS